VLTQIQIDTIKKSLRSIGAEAVIQERSESRREGRRWVSSVNDLAIDVRNDRFEVAFNKDANLEIIPQDIQPRDRHLLMLARVHHEDGSVEKLRFLMGHDERHWFVAGIAQPVSSVEAAKESLKPAAIRAKQDRVRPRRKERNRRHNSVFLRQGEWFFAPQPNLEIGDAPLFRDEPIRRGGGKAHIIEEVVRLGGETVYVCPRFPNGLTEREYQALLKGQPKMRLQRWTLMKRDAQVYARGRVRHPDHKTLLLTVWHRVFMSEEDNRGMRVAFLD
jgi:hypothetical protein